MRSPGISLLAVHETQLQLRRSVYRGHHGLLVRHRITNLPDFLDSARQRGGYDLCGHGVESGGADARPSGSVSCDRAALSQGAADDPCLTNPYHFSMYLTYPYAIYNGVH